MKNHDIKKLNTLRSTMLDIGMGSGVLLDEGYVLTAAHCLPKYPDPKFAGADFGDAHAFLYHVARYGRGKKEAFAVLRGFEPVLDLAILQILDEDYHDHPEDWQKQGDRLLKKRTPAMLAEWDPLRTEYPVRVLDRKSSWVTGKARTGPGWPTIAITDLSGPIHGGTSGAPVFDDQDRVVGLISCGIVFRTLGDSVRTLPDSESGSDTLAVHLQWTLPAWFARQAEAYEAVAELSERERHTRPAVNIVSSAAAARRASRS